MNETSIRRYLNSLVLFERAFELCSSNSVSVERVDGSSLLAVCKSAEGTTLYNVSVDVEGSNILRSTCTCPFSGRVCKHVGAVLLFIMNNRPQHSTAETVEIDNDPQEAETPQRQRRILPHWAKKPQQSSSDGDAASKRKREVRVLF
jgi:uncharacterized Zn finger protein